MTGGEKLKRVQETFKPSCIFQQVSLLSFLNHGILSENRTEEKHIFLTYLVIVLNPPNLG